MHNAKAARGAQTQRTTTYVICETRAADKVRRDLARFYLQFLQSDTLLLFARDFVVFSAFGSPQWQPSDFLVCLPVEFVFAINISFYFEALRLELSV